ncbi:hypothetical protein WJ970_03405 [Achromobacter xylosoxidans]
MIILPASQSDRDYERERFSRNVIHESARYLERKHGFDIWGDGLEHWLTLRHEALGLGAAPLEPTIAVEPPVEAARPKVALVIDVDGWAFSNIARQLQRHLGDRFDFKLIASQDLPEPGHIFMAAADCHLVHFFWREYLRLIDHEWARGCIQRMGISLAEFEHRFIANKAVTTSVYDHLHLEDGQIMERIPFFRDRVAAYTVASERLARIYGGIPGMPAPACVAQDGVDLSLFVPRQLERFQSVASLRLSLAGLGTASGHPNSLMSKDSTRSCFQRSNCFARKESRLKRALRIARRVLSLIRKCPLTTTLLIFTFARQP